MATSTDAQLVPPSFIEFYDSRTKFSRWIARLEGAFEIYKISEVSQKRAYFLHYIGASTFDTLCDLLSPDEPNKRAYDEIKKILQDHFDPEPLEIAEYYKFHHRKQEDGEHSREYMAVLRKMAATCNFGCFLETALRNQFTCGLRDDRIREKIMETKELTLERALNIAQSMEARKTHEMQVHAVQRGKQPQYSLNQPTTERISRRLVCYRCGGPHYADKCPHILAQCTYCKKQGHLKRSCLKAKREEKKKDVGCVEETDVGQGENTTAEYKVNYDYDIYMLDKCDKIVVQAKINKKCIQMELDSGSAVSVIGQKEFEYRFPNVKLQDTKVQLRSYSNNCLNVLGLAEVDVEVLGELKEKLELYVVSDVDKMPLFGRQWLRSFSHKILTRILEVNKVNSNLNEAGLTGSLETLLQKYKTLFDDSIIGEIKGEPVALHLKEGSKPIFCKARPVPFSLKSKVEHKIDRLVQSGILVKVDYSEYATPVVPVQKPNGEVRLCGDFKVTINPQMIVDEHPLPTPEELFAGLAGGEKFTKIDLRCAYLQWSVREEDQKYLTLIYCIGALGYCMG